MKKKLYGFEKVIWKFCFSILLPLLFVASFFLSETANTNSDIKFWLNQSFVDQDEKQKITDQYFDYFNLVRKEIGKNLKNKKGLPSSVLANDNETIKIEYSFEPNLKKYIENLLISYASDFTSVVVIDNDTGKILSINDYSRKSGVLPYLLAFSNKHPAASLFKIVTTADLLDKVSIDPEENFFYQGRPTKLYKYQLKNYDGNSNNWKKTTLQEAFAKSNNVVFAKAALNYLDGEDLYSMALKLGFNQGLLLEVNLPPSVTIRPESEYHFAELASGFNTDTLISPIHAAVLSSLVPNEGKLIYPQLINKLTHSEKNLDILHPTMENKQVLDESVILTLKTLMGETVRSGTAKKSFKKMNKSLLNKLNIGGKTGSITGGKPYGRHDWFVSYAYPKNKDQGKGISICVMIVNKKRWYVKSSFLAQKIIEYYFQNINSIL